MPVTCDQLVAYSESIDKKSGELECRAAISRAYYGAYHHSLKWEQTLPEGGQGGEVGGVHQQLINRLSKPSAKCAPEFNVKSRSLAYRLMALKVLRTKADYELGVEVSLEEAVKACTEARAILTSFTT